MKAPIGHVVHCKLLKGRGLHTFVVGMIGYWLKDAREKHFKVVDINPLDVEKNASIDE
jgi:hypothetical protein